MIKTIKQIAAVLTLVGMFFGGWFTLDKVFAKDKELQQLKQSFEQKMDSDRLKAVSERIWYIEGKPKKDAMDLKDLNELKQEQELLKERLKGR